MDILERLKMLFMSEDKLEKYWRTRLNLLETAAKFDGRVLSSPINGRKGGRPRKKTPQKQENDIS
jgi:hypothetical protein